jgi:tripartite-type tricarboxylate transporter receptor subunit TctC
VSTSSRAEVLPQVPTLAEQGLPNYEVTLWFGLWAPSATPAAVVQKLNLSINAIVQEPQVREQFARLGMQPSAMKPEEVARFVGSEIEFYKRIVKQAGIEPQ